MRAGPLADDKVISLLNRYFVPVYVSNEDYGKDGSVSAEEKKAYTRIYHEALREKRSAGSVCVYLVSPEGKGIASMIVSTAAQKGKLQGLLEDTIKQLGTTEGKPLIAPASQSTPPKHEKDDLVLHLVSRVDHRGSWGEFPSENWIVLKPADVAKMLPPADARAGVTWDLDTATATKVLTHFYPQTETCDCDHDALPDGSHHHRIEKVLLQGKVLSAKDGVLRARLEGSLRIKHSFYPGRDDDNRASAEVVGYFDIDQKKNAIRNLRLVTRSATYGKFGFTVAVASEPRSE